MPSTRLVDATVADGIATVRLNRPEKLNAVTLESLAKLRDALVGLSENAEGDEAIGGLVVAGAGDVTCAGMDRDVVADPDYDEKYGDDVARLTSEVYDFLTSRPYPTVVAARGALIGIGFILSLRCDFLVLGEETTLSLPEVQFGIAATHTIPHLEAVVGTRVATEIALAGEPIPPVRALELGLANRVVPNDEVEEAATELVETIAAHDAHVVRELKAATSSPE
ncbi:enoyl-CoA hydratase/isomerase family protein [Natrialbaceae archaeon GCM10025810]|uniref:enoyl-CoA hydratase/isomerase family protein n=1 Tax=Halovalidus salilacus TaxID=3075124 RepID=UPI0036145063